jgi:hypothetical protein
VQHSTYWGKTLLAVIPISLTVFAAGLLGGGIAADITVIIVIAAVALALIGIYNGVRNLVSLCELRRD